MRRLQADEWDEEYFRKGLDEELQYLREEVQAHFDRAKNRKKQTLVLSTKRWRALQELARRAHQKDPSGEGRNPGIPRGKGHPRELDRTESSWQGRRERGRRTLSPALRDWALNGKRVPENWEGGSGVGPTGESGDGDVHKTVRQESRGKTWDFFSRADKEQAHRLRGPLEASRPDRPPGWTAHIPDRAVLHWGAMRNFTGW